MNILIIQTAFIGDVVLTTPLLQAAKERLDANRLSVVVRPSTAELLYHNPSVDELIPYDKHGKERGISGLMALAGRLRARRFDIALIPHRSLRSALLAWLARIPARAGFDTSAGRWLLTHRMPYRPVHEVDRNLDLLQPWTVVEDGAYTPALFPNDENSAFADSFLAAHNLHEAPFLIGLSPGSIWPTKRWIPGRFAEVARRIEHELGARIVLFGGPEDAGLCRVIAAQTDGRPIIAAGQASLLQSAALVSRCAALVSNDSAMAHIAAAMGARVIDIFGPTVPAFGFSPCGSGHRIIEQPLSCRPCGRHGGVRCPIGTHECMTRITAEQVFEAVRYTVAHGQGSVAHHKEKQTR